VTVSVDGEKATGIWRPLVIRGVPLHIVLPASSAVFGVALLLTGGVAAIVGGWILTVAFPLALGAFVADARALAVPAVLWATWVVVVAVSGEGSGLPQTPLVLAVVLAALGAVGVWLGQRAVQPAVEHPHGTERNRGTLDIDELLAPLTDPADSPSLDPSAEVNEAIAELLEEELASDLDERIDVEDEASVPVHHQDPQPQVEGEISAEADGDDDPTGHAIEFAALREEDLLSGDDAPLPAATEAGRRDGD
jgi:hypothetical protein